MMERCRVEQLVILALSFACVIAFVRSVSAGFPIVSDVIVWNDSGNTVLNVTVSHSPQTLSHYLDRVEVDLDGDNRVFPVAYRSETTFVVRCDLGIVEAPIDATVRAHCNIDGYSLSPYGPILVPEFPSILALLLFMILSILSVALANKRLSRKLKV